MGVSSIVVNVVWAINQNSRFSIKTRLVHRAKRMCALQTNQAAPFPGKTSIKKSIKLGFQLQKNLKCKCFNYVLIFLSFAAQKKKFPNWIFVAFVRSSYFVSARCLISAFMNCKLKSVFSLFHSSFVNLKNIPSRYLCIINSVNVNNHLHNETIFHYFLSTSICRMQ